MTAPKLDTILATNVPVSLTLVRRSGPYDNKFKPGENQWLYIFSQKGNEYSQYVNEREQKTLEHFKYGEEVICTRKEAAGDKGRFYFREWTAPGDISASAAPQMQSNTNVVRTQPKQQSEYQDEQAKREMRISLAGLMQAHIASGKWPNEEALKLAIEAKKLLDAHVERSFGNPDVFAEEANMSFGDYLNGK